MKKYFGTDGVRGLSNTHPMTADFALKLGMSAAIVLGKVSNKTNRVIIGKDTRLSCYMLETVLTAGLTSMGKDVLLLGPMPTPAVAMLTRSMRADLGIMISASHNPYYDNGIKLFDKFGYKLSDEDELKIEDLIDKNIFSDELVKPDKIGKVERLKESYGRYIQFVKNMFPNKSLHNLKIVIDCANGAGYKVAPTILYELGATVIALGCEPNGININDACGSTHINNLKAKVLETGADLGLALDGDADRIIMVDEKGNILDGDKILAIIATNMKNEGRLKNNKVATTVMANMGFEKYMNSKGIDVIRTAVGDRYVCEALVKHDINLGGEQSGHIVISDYNTTGDGLVAGLEVISFLLDKNQPASKVFNLYTDYPQILKNINYSKKNPLEDVFIANFIKSKQEEYTGKVRILARKSGTENLVRIMVEGESYELISNVLDDILKHINKIVD